MKKSLFLIVLLFLHSYINAQDSLYKLDVLRAPSSPAANLIGTSPSDVQSFTDPTAFMVSLQNATDNFSSLPKSYAVDIAPAWLFNGKNIHYHSFASAAPRYSIPQSLVISAAVKTTDDSTGKNSKLGIGAKVSICRGSFGKSHFKSIDSMLKMLSLALTDKNKFDKEFNKNVKMDSLTKVASSTPALQSAIGHIMDSLVMVRTSTYNKIVQSSPSTKAFYDSLKNVASRIVMKRYGFKLDIAGGASFDIPNQVYADGSLTNAGAWVTSGVDMESGFSIIGLARYLYHPEKILADDSGTLKPYDVSTFDVGGKLQYENLQYHLTISAETLYRSVINHDLNSWRYTINADYEIKKNTHLTLAIGKDFDNTFHKDGTLITALNLLFGLGNGKKLN